jgi:hypothetical protein
LAVRLLALAGGQQPLGRVGQVRRIAVEVVGRRERRGVARLAQPDVEPLARTPCLKAGSKSAATMAKGSSTARPLSYSVEL